MLSPHYWQSQGSHSQGFTGGSNPAQLEAAAGAGSGDKFSPASIQEASDRFARGVQSRFGKWRVEYGVAAGQDGPATQRVSEFEALDKSAKVGLRRFGYVAGDGARAGTGAVEVASGFACTQSFWSSQTCRETDTVLSQLPWLVGENRELEGLADAAGSKRRKSCGLQIAMDWRGCPSCNTDIRDVQTATVDSCCKNCERDRRCSHFTYDIGRKICFLKQDGGAAVAAHGGQLISGHIAAS